MKGKVRVPSSKSISNRLLILKAISQDRLEITNLSDAEDTRMLNKTLEEIKETPDFIYNLDLGNCGTCVRFLTSYLSVIPGIFVLNGNKRMQQRPIGPLVEALQSLGAQIAYVNKEGFLPLYINGGFLEGGRVEIDCSISSQFATALMLVAPALRGGLEVIVRGVKSVSYLDMTLLLMKKLGLNVEKIGNFHYKISQQQIPNQTVRVSADWSSASFWYALVALSKDAELFIYDLQDCGLQGDRIVADIYENLGVHTNFDEKGVLLTKKNIETDFWEMDMSSYPDLALPLIVNLVLLGVSFRLYGLDHLQYKESNRLLALKNELKKIGADLIVDDYGNVKWDREEIFFPDKLIFNSYDDHRIAMSLSQVAMFTQVEIDNAEKVVKKSYPDFWVNLSKFKLK